MSTINSRASYIALLALAVLAVLLGLALIAGLIGAGLWLLVPVATLMAGFGVKQCLEILSDIKDKAKA